MMCAIFAFVVYLLSVNSGQMLKHVVCLVFLFICQFTDCYFILNQINGDGDGKLAS